MFFNKNVESITEAESIAINQIVYDKRSKGERVYTFSLGEAFFSIPKFSIDEDIFLKGYHYSGSLGLDSLRKKISELYKEYYGVESDYKTEVLISCGSKVIIYMILQSLINEGDEVIIPEPAWLSYKTHVKLVNGRAVSIPYDKEVFDWENYITPRTRVIIINNPNNPSGKIYKTSELEHILHLAKKYKIIVISDEAYSDFMPSNQNFYSLYSFDKAKEHSIIVNSLSKNMGLSGWRIGYTIAKSDIVNALLKLNQHLITCAPTILQQYLSDHFYDILQITLPQIKSLMLKRSKVQEIMNDLEINYLKGDGTFYFLIDISSSGVNSRDFARKLLINNNIAVVPGIAYGKSTDSFIRFGIGTESLEDIKSSLLVLKTYLKKNG